MDNMNLSPDMMDKLINLAGQKLGKDPSSLKASLESGNLDQVISGLDPKLQNKISEFAGNPKAVEGLLKNNNVNSLLSGLMKKG